MSHVRTGNITHDTTVAFSEGQRQAIVAAASTQAAVRTADIAHYRACLASAIANNCGRDTFVSALRELGTGGS